MSRSRLDRDAIVARLAAHVLDTGLGQASLRPLARAIGTSDRMLLYYFPDKSALLRAVLGRVAGALTAVLDARIPATPARAPAALLTELDALLDDGLLRPYLKLWAEIMVAAERGEEPFASLADEIGAGFHHWVADRLDVEDEAARGALASLLLVAIDGAVLLGPVAQGRHGRDAMAALRGLLRSADGT
ncbi:TetR/AcrR family transcriptional regulator [Novosphingobium piscinae]|uniref:TetR/AcrR family transcriptional regulator n=1 Tax=Novosphingobium piscinae TaxID=1507448 RepID=UPI001C8C3F58